MRRVLIPLCLVALLAVLTFGAAVAGWRSSPNSAPTAEGTARTDLGVAVRMTLGARSLTMDLNGNTQVVYEAPDRLQVTGMLNIIQIGSLTLTKSSDPFTNSSTVWLEEPSSLKQRDFALFYSPQAQLKRLLTLPDVRQQGNSFVAKRSLLAFGDPHRTVTEIENVHTNGRFIVSDRTTFTGAVSSALTLRSTSAATCTSSCRFESTRIYGSDANLVTFGDFDSAHLSPPPRTDIVAPTTVATRRIGRDHLTVYEWWSGNPKNVTTGFSLTNPSGTPISSGSGGPLDTLPLPEETMPLPEADALLPNGGGGSGPGSWSDETVSVVSTAIERVRLIINGSTADSMVPAGRGSTRFVILIGRDPKVGGETIQGLNASGQVVASVPSSW